ncbi:hypothetical protein [Terasakiella sp. SH-1]|uniref:AbiTii domain-containing protein n=1 Tax=Terasakiella sp. SH-1 TaxID=2560057 RepID=UPI0010746C9F|nr:hypothetical protein [Terasakiella sp. SH-1]
MSLIDQIIEQSVDDSVRLPVILRKCLVVAAKLKNERLKEWASSELNGYPNAENLPEYRTASIQAKGIFLGPLQGQLNNQPLTSWVLEEEHRWWATTAHFTDGVAAYEQLTSDIKEERLKLDWPADLIAYYQTKFIDGWVLNQAWQDIPPVSLIHLVDTVRNRVLEFALDIKNEMGDEDIELTQIKTEHVETAVQTIIYGGNNIIADNIGDNLQQANETIVLQGNFDTLKNKLSEIGVSDEQINELSNAIDADAGKEDDQVIGKQASSWLTKTLLTAGKEGGKIAGEAARTLITQAVLSYFGE